MRHAGISFEKLAIAPCEDKVVTVSPLVAEFWGLEPAKLNQLFCLHSGFYQLGLLHAEDLRQDSSEIVERLGCLGRRGHNRISLFLSPRIVLVLGLISDTSRGEALRRSLNLPNPQQPLSVSEVFPMASIESKRKRFDRKPKEAKTTKLAIAPTPESAPTPEPVVEPKEEVQQSKSLGLLSSSTAELIRPLLEQVNREFEEAIEEQARWAKIAEEKRKNLEELEALIG